MIGKIGRFFEEHVEKIILVIVGLVCAFLLITRVILSPNAVEYKGEKFSPGTVDTQIFREAQTLGQRLNDPPEDIEPYKPRVDDFLALLDSSIQGVDVNLWPVVPSGGELEQTVAGVYRLPEIGEVNDVAIEHIRTVAYVPLAPVTPETPYDKAGNEANDLDLVTVAAKYDIRGLYERFNENFLLDVEPEQPEADIEGATMIGRRIYWITSHGRNKDGKIRSSRYRFFATDVDVDGQKVAIKPVGRPCETLAHELVKSRMGRRLGLDKATRFDDVNLKKKDREKLAPKEDGLNIEALCASADGETIYIGFRNPRPEGGLSRRPQALVVPLLNADGIVERSESPAFGEPILWDLRGLGIRSMEYSGFHNAYFIVAGGPDDEGSDFFLCRWSDIARERPILIRPLNLSTQFTAEALIPFAGSGRFLLLSDDGSIPVKVSGPHECAKGQYRKDGTCQNKYLLDSEKRTFRGIWLRP